MKKYTMSFGDATTHQPAEPRRTARRNIGGSGTMNFDVVFQVWPNRASLARTVRMQEQRAGTSHDWKPCVTLTPGEGY